jgi:hypothetical protein
MEEIYQRAIEFSNLAQTFSIQRKLLKEKNDARLTYGYNGGIFKINQTLICFVQFLISKNRVENVILLDVNENPILIENFIEFSDEILDRYTTSVYEYHEQYELLKKARSVKKIVDL